MVSPTVVDLAVTWGVALLLALLAALLLRPVLKRRAARRAIERRIGWMGLRQLRNVLIDDGMEGKIFIERLLLTADGLRVLVQNRRNGNVFGGDNIDVWAQVVGKRTRRFPNPHYAVSDVVATLRSHLPGVPVAGSVLFAGDCVFPKGKPQNTLTLDDLPAAAPEQDDHVLVGTTLAAAWEKLGGMMEPVTNPVLIGDEVESRHVQVGAAVALLLAAVAWVAWRLWAAHAPL